MKAVVSLSSLLIGAALLGCGADTPSQVTGSRQSALTSPNGTNLNGTNLNGTNLNGTNLNGTNLNGPAMNLASVDFAGATREGHDGNKLDSVWIDGSELYGTQGNSTFHALDFDDVRFQATLGDGSPVTVQVMAAYPPAAGSDIWSYQVAYFDPTLNDWAQLCPQADGTNAPAIPVNGVWNYDFGTPGGGAWHADPARFTFACEHAAVAKCIHMGYEPWKSAVDGTALHGHLEACVRVIRADYCGDGTSYTVNGQLVDIWDGKGLQVDDQPDWYFEAEWDKDGARCFSTHNRAHANVTCYDARKTSDCGAPDHFNTGALLMTKTPYKK